MALNAGDMDREVTLQQLSESRGATGFPVDNWTTLDGVWASRMDANRNRSVFSAAQLAEPFDAAWQIYYRADMDPEALDVPKLRRLVYQGRKYEIVAAAILGFQEGLALLTVAASEVSAQ